ncbi:MAG: hypothetical protein KBE65_18410 [Phycisphaerae bacterium]|nr:hypothetical protein [Phycisphaerae bacterium]
MTSGNRSILIVALVALLAPGLGGVARSQGGTSTETPRKTFTISGTVGVPGVKFKGLPGDPVSDDQGRFSIEVPNDLNGYVMPIKEGYVFNPPFVAFGPASRIDNVHFTARVVTFAISGNVGVPGVAMKGLPGYAVADSQGRYRAQVEYGWSGTVTPTREGYCFEPAERVYAQVTADQGNQNYKAQRITLEISGCVGLPGVVMKGFPVDVLTDSAGVYVVQVDYGWSGTVTPEKEGYAFMPPSRTFQKVESSLTNQDCTADVMTFTISGLVRVLSASGAVGVEGVALTGFPGDVITDANGRFTATVPYGWTGTVIPSRTGYTFTPQLRKHERVRSRIEAHYEAKPLMHTLSDVAAVDNLGPIAGVRVLAEPGGYSAVTDSQGRYWVKVPYGWSGRLVLSHPDFEFGVAPQYRDVTSDIIDGEAVAISAREQMVAISSVIVSNGEPVQGLTLLAEPGGYSAVTDEQGRYTIRVPYGWSGQLIPQAQDSEVRSKIPPSSYVNVTGDIIDGNCVEMLPRQMLLSSRSRLGLRQADVGSSTGGVLVIPVTDTAPERIAETTEDMRVMLHILKDKLNEPRMILGVLRDYGSFFDEGRTVEALYLQGTAVVFIVQVDFPYSFPAQQPAGGEAEQEPADPVWEQARQKLRSPPGSRTLGSGARTPRMTFDQFKDELLRSLKHAANLRNIDPNEQIILTVVAQNEGASRAGGADAMRLYREVYGSDLMATMGAVRRARTPATTVLTMQASKADVDAFAKGGLEFDQFRQKVRSFTY